MSLLKVVKSQLAFFTIIQVEASFEDAVRYSAFAPLIVGSIAALLDFGSFYSLSLLSPLAVIATLAVMEAFRGFNHLDGLLDFGDALMVKGTREDKVRALKDVQVGAGGVGLLLVYALLSVAALASARADFSLFLSAESLSRALGIALVYYSKHMPESSMGRAFKEGAAVKPLVLVWVALFGSPLQWTAFIFMFFAFRAYSERTLGGVNGDVSGAAITLSTPVLMIAQEVGERSGLGFSPLSLSLWLSLSTLHSASPP
ncbi:MAG: adenosylcobinamide-GDP ribazoletransferase [Thermoprotei archaeon]